ncbi:hypothetical protein ACFVU3_39460 [Streptomyces sp. NPDC058052]|uniref:hypothetical protein n=1 Tax=Streptomyces sp. NPDC058052 TaxID=3346316 RepID=UPI0036E9DB96
MKTATRTGPPSFGRILMVATGMLMLELTLVAVGFTALDATRESSEGGGYAFELGFLPLMAPFSALFGGVGAVVLVVPTIVLAGSLGRRFGGGSEAWWWVVAAAVPVAAGGSLMAGLYVLRSVDGTLAAWPALLAAIVPAALVARLPRRWLLRGIALWGTVAVAVTALLGGLALGTGVLEEYRPPAVTRSELVGTWTDGRGGTLELAADGTATADGVMDPSGFAPLPGEEVETCTARGTWTLAGADGQGESVVTDLPGCLFEPWSIGGEDGRPALRQWDVDGEETVGLTRDG